MTSSPICIVGTGVAGLALMQELRRRDPAVAITALAHDAGDYCYRPNFSTAMARGLAPAALITESAASWSDRLAVTLRSNTRIDRIDPARRIVATLDGDIEYGALVFATGARTRVPLLAGDCADAVLRIDDLPAFTHAYPALLAAEHVVVLGAGLVGCEVADDLARSGRRVTVFDPAPQPLARSLPPGIGRRMMAALSARGVVWRLGQSVSSIEAVGSRLQIHSARSGVEAGAPAHGGPEHGGLEHVAPLLADAVVSAAGLVPRSGLARLAGLSCLPAVPVDAGMATNLSHVFAIGDVAHPPGGWRPFVAGALQGARVLAERLTGNADARFDGSPRPIRVKTALFPMRLLPPVAPLGGQWRVLQDDVDAFAAHYVDQDERLLGYALGGHRVNDDPRSLILATEDAA